MKPRLVFLAAGLLLFTACAGAPLAAQGSQAALQNAASLMVSIGQHGEGADVADLEAQLNAALGAAPEDPFVLKLIAEARRTLSDYSQDRAERVRLRQTALGEFDKAIALAGASQASRVVRINGQETEVDLKDLPDLRAQLFQQVQTDR